MWSAVKYSAMNCYRAVAFFLHSARVEVGQDTYHAGRNSVQGVNVQERQGVSMQSKSRNCRTICGKKEVQTVEGRFSESERSPLEDVLGVKFVQSA